MSPIVVKDPLGAQGYRTQRAESPEDLWQPLYDRVNLATATPTSVSFFAGQRGSSATLIPSGGGAATAKVKTYRDTNIDNANVVPTKMFKFVGVSLGFIHQSYTATTNAKDRNQIRDAGVVQIRIVDKDILYLPLTSIPEVNPIISTTMTGSESMAGGGGQNVPMYKFPIPVTLNPYENFSLTINFDTTFTLSNSVDLQVIMHAFMRRPT